MWHQLFGMMGIWSNEEYVGCRVFGLRLPILKLFVRASQQLQLKMPEAKVSIQGFVEDSRFSCAVGAWVEA